ncbi:Bifunctional protein GlmU [Cymbomonas tetramitiformis]|uniref:Bifunctional protein GlmU n=1 Tax=Cymbomonas tetramitiformis TaxID=36881 RepID=A0AAE0L6W4_9CHLO|nr:Bifunctional protein GlmU [Cymbomonas tetramitiformis]
MDTTTTMATIFTGLFSALFGCSLFLKRDPQAKSSWLSTHSCKRKGEEFTLLYTPFWIFSVGIVIGMKEYERWDEWGYMAYCVCCALPYVLYPLLFPFASDSGIPWYDRYITKANLWIAIFSFIGNYWYTHYFYHVLKADYTFPAHRLNDVPICLYFMTHAYFMFYHILSNMTLRRVRTTFVADAGRLLFETALVIVMSYTTAFMESLTICGFPYYKFEDVHMAYTIGSAFYGIYFLVSFPMFLRVDEDANHKFTLFQTAVEALGSSMLVLCMLDFVRLFLGVPIYLPH